MKRLILIGLFVILMVSMVSADGSITGKIDGEEYSISLGEEINFDDEDFPFGEKLEFCHFVWEEKRLEMGWEGLEGMDCTLENTGSLKLNVWVKLISDLEQETGSPYSFSLFGEMVYNIDANTRFYFEMPYDEVRVELSDRVSQAQVMIESTRLVGGEVGQEFTFSVSEVDVDGEMENRHNFELRDEGLELIPPLSDEGYSVIVNDYPLNVHSGSRIEYDWGQEAIIVTMNYLDEDMDCLGSTADSSSLEFTNPIDPEDTNTYTIYQDKCNTEIYLDSPGEGVNNIEKGFEVYSKTNSNNIDVKVSKEESSAWTNFVLSNGDMLNLILEGEGLSKLTINKDENERGKLFVCYQNFNFAEETTFGDNTYIEFSASFVEGTEGRAVILCDFYTANFEYNSESADGSYYLEFGRDYPKFNIYDASDLGPHSGGMDGKVLEATNTEGGAQWRASSNADFVDTTNPGLIKLSKLGNEKESKFEISLSQEVVVKEIVGFDWLNVISDTHYSLYADQFRIGNVDYMPENGQATIYLDGEGGLESNLIAAAAVSEIENEKVFSFFDRFASLITGRATTDDLADELDELEEGEVDGDLYPGRQPASVGTNTGEWGEEGYEVTGLSGGSGEDIDLADGFTVDQMGDIEVITNGGGVGGYDDTMQVFGENTNVVFNSGGHLYNYETGKKYVLKRGSYEIHAVNSKMAVIDCCSGGGRVENLDRGVYHSGCVPKKGRYDKSKQPDERLAVYRLESQPTCSGGFEDIGDALVGDNGELKSELEPGEIEEEFLDKCADKGEQWGCNCARRTVDSDGSCVSKTTYEGLWIKSECDGTQSCDSTSNLCFGDQFYCCTPGAKTVSGVAYKGEDSYAFYTDDVDGHEFVCKETGKIEGEEGLGAVASAGLGAANGVLGDGTADEGGEICDNQIDDDGDELVDCMDRDCSGQNGCEGGGTGFCDSNNDCPEGSFCDGVACMERDGTEVEICDNGLDDDGDEFVDCTDTECFGHEVCPDREESGCVPNELYCKDSSPNDIFYKDEDCQEFVYESCIDGLCQETMIGDTAEGSYAYCNIDIDADGDGIVDSDDNCPENAGNVFNNGCPEGECSTGDCFDGNGFMDYDDGSDYDGNFVDGVPEGYGVMTYSDGTTYYGNWRQGEWHDSVGGMYCIDDYNCYFGEFSAGAMTGPGTYEFSGGKELVLESSHSYDLSFVDAKIMADDVQSMEEAMDGWGTDEKTVESILEKYGSNQEMLAMFVDSYDSLGSSLEDDIVADFGGNARTELLACLSTTSCTFA
jgi:hypothetical protein